MRAPSPKRRLELVPRKSTGGPASTPPPVLIGREEIIERIERELRSGRRLLTLLGPPGIGKTTVAGACLRRFTAARTFPGGAHFCDLSQARTEDDLLFAVLSVFGEHQRRIHLAHDDVRARVVEMLVELGDAVLVLDNFEQLSFAAEIVHGWVSAAPRISVVVTSRERLAVAGELVLELPPLACPSVGDADPLVAESEAVRLFVARARDAGGDVGTDASALAEIVRRLEGIPLAIELAAARTRLLSAAELATRLAAGHEVLGAARGGSRHATLAKAIDWSWNLLPPEEQRALARCSVFAGSFTLDAAEHVTGASMETISALRDKSLIHPVGEGRLALYVSIREYASKKLGDLGAGEEREQHLRHARHYAEGARRFNDARNLQAENPEPELHGTLRREKENVTAALAFVQRLPPDGEAALLQKDLSIAIASLYALPGDACVEALSAALRALRTRADHAADAASVLLARQLVWSALGRHEDCLRDLEELRTAPGVPAGLRTLALIYRGIQERFHGDARKALASHEEAARELDALLPPRRRLRAMNDACTGRLHCDLRNVAAAREHNRRATDASEAIGDVWLSALAFANIAQLEQEEGALDRAAELLGAALTRLKTAGEAHYEAIYGSVCGDLAFERGDYESARRWYAEGARYFGPLLAHRQAGILHAAAAALEATEGDLVAAAAHLDIAERSAARSGNPIVRQVVDAHRGTVEIIRAGATERSRALATWKAWRERIADPTSNEGALAATSMDVRFALRILDRTLREQASPASTSLNLRLADDASWFATEDGERIDLRRRGALRRILVALCAHHESAPGTGLGVQPLIDSGWPGERVLVDAAATRVRVAVSTLRRLGLRSVIVTRDDGYLLDPRVRIERRGPDDSPLLSAPRR